MQIITYNDEQIKKSILNYGSPLATLTSVLPSSRVGYLKIRDWSNAREAATHQSGTYACKCSRALLARRLILKVEL